MRRIAQSFSASGWRSCRVPIVQHSTLKTAYKRCIKGPWTSSEVDVDTGAERDWVQVSNISNSTKPWHRIWRKLPSQLKQRRNHRRKSSYYGPEWNDNESVNLDEDVTGLTLIFHEEDEKVHIWHFHPVSGSHLCRRTVRKTVNSQFMKISENWLKNEV